MLLDCTLRDGGFVNDWEFGYSSIRSIVSRLDSAGVEIVEVGYINGSRAYDKNRSMFPDTASINKTLSGLSVKHAMLVALTDFGYCPPENILPCAQSVIDGIRVTFKKKEIDAALDFCTGLKEKGYQVFLNPVSLTSYTDREILDLLEKVNGFMPFAVSIVDTYGLMLNDDILHFVDLVDKNLAPGILLGYHSHNNQQMAYANCCTLLDRRTCRRMVVDASLFGMGKGAGNANIELVASYANKVHGGEYKTEQMLDCIYTDIMRIHKETPWGYNLQSYMAAINDVHPNYIRFLLKKNTLSIQGINEIVGRIPPAHKLAYSQELVEHMYIEYQAHSINDAEVYQRMEAALASGNILLVFPGGSVKTHEAEINQYIGDNSPVIISVNYIPSSIAVDYVFVGNRKRYDALSDSYFLLDGPPGVIATSNILESNVPVAYQLNYATLLPPENSVQDNSSVLCLNFLKKTGVQQVAIAGMDGFSPNSEYRFAEPFMDMYDSYDTLANNDKEMAKFILSIKEHMALNFITPSIFDDGGEGK